MAVGSLTVSMRFATSDSRQLLASHFVPRTLQNQRLALATTPRVRASKGEALSTTPRVRASKGEADSVSTSENISRERKEGSSMNLAPPRTSDVGQDFGNISDSQELRTYERLFSNLNEANLQHDPGSLSSAILLIAGTTVGAGILAIPAVTQEAGFLASSFTCLLCWLYMVTTGLLVAEVNVSTMCELGSGGVSLVSMAMRTMGRGGVFAACISYLFIHYALLVAYIARSSEILTSALGFPPWLSAATFSAVFGGICYFGSQRAVGAINGFLVAGIIGSFALLVFAAAGELDWGSLLKANFAAVPMSIPIIALSFVYQNVVPVVCTNLEGDLKRIRSAIIWGTSIPLVMFLIWDAVILGSLSGAVESEDPLNVLRSENSLIGPIVQVFSVLAISTSYIGFVLGLADFLADLLKLPSGRGNQPLPYILTVVPPLILALISPGIFFKALDFAGTYGVLTLFGLLPAAMAWNERYGEICIPSPFKPIVPGGRVVLCIVIAGAGYVITSDIISSLFIR
ncbi:hypothetical protein KP509_06G046100 [Ceratopteris richardii]|uniref:Tyrosine-specific transport protein n=1 Tax=Ceratopteris richardii TaxID=49495 RepID=A0A8T2UFM5_CERRI|nr:hypothetical protein KP509_06G046100 [Ceratopteris richardii]